MSDYSLIMNDANVAAGQTLVVDNSINSIFNRLTFDGSAETDGQFDILVGSRPGYPHRWRGRRWLFDLPRGRERYVPPAALSDDLFLMGGSLATGDKIDGGAGNDTVALDGTYSNLTLASGMLKNIETIQLAAGSSYKITPSSATLGGPGRH